MRILISVGESIIGVHAFSMNGTEVVSFFYDDWEALFKSFDMDSHKFEVRIISFKKWMGQL